MVHDLADLLRERPGQRAAEDGEVLGEHEDGAPVDPAGARDHPVTGNLGLGHAEVGRAVRLEAVVFAEGSGVDQQLDALARGELPLGVLAVDARLAAAAARGRELLVQQLQFFFDRQGWYSFCACSAVIAARLTISSTLAVG